MFERLLVRGEKILQVKLGHIMASRERGSIECPLRHMIHKIRKLLCHETTRQDPDIVCYQTGSREKPPPELSSGLSARPMRACSLCVVYTHPGAHGSSVLKARCHFFCPASSCSSGSTRLTHADQPPQAVPRAENYINLQILCWNCYPEGSYGTLEDRMKPPGHDESLLTIMRKYN